MLRLQYTHRALVFLNHIICTVFDGFPGALAERRFGPESRMTILGPRALERRYESAQLPLDCSFLFLGPDTFRDPFPRGETYSTPGPPLDTTTRGIRLRAGVLVTF